jgi:hypothetical protein
MSKHAQSILAAILAVFGIIGLAGVVYLVWVFPHLLVERSDDGQALSIVERYMATLGKFCQWYGLVLMPALLASTIGCGVWSAIAIKTSKKECEQ